jgi:hypothetical protein
MGMILLYILCGWLALGFFHYIFFVKVFRRKSQFGMFILCLFVGAPFFVYEFYRIVKGK